MCAECGFDEPKTTPPDTWTPEWGTKREYIHATMAYAAYWRHHDHAFELCRQCPKCKKCFRCSLTADHPIHDPANSPGVYRPSVKRSKRRASANGSTGTTTG